MKEQDIAEGEFSEVAEMAEQFETAVKEEKKNPEKEMVSMDEVLTKSELKELVKKGQLPKSILGMKAEGFNHPTKKRPSRAQRIAVRKQQKAGRQLRRAYL